ncbi:hypothetical protein PAAG_01124 [Paracoccidioides lutzii Pb01]|uniref:Uncharacterized protein n=1 Tax=Paracoccidioides lutzii (strain ATCC MYA-826 / Pb01) TaxID=502779 RepID=C1GRH9_PARBA|nr:hypothetical protein PAAG_01124 [Paracoccidioides lutzii Pb01]EEH38203.1 hypothetical protein PAAG_01124 [Paracoccidioides lutzii Pb01]
MASQQPSTLPIVRDTPPGAGEIAASPSIDSSTPHQLTATGAGADGVLAENKTAIASDPSLRATAPNPEWEDYETIIAKNPELMAPVVTNQEKLYYKSKVVWECGHEGPEIITSIEKESGDSGELSTFINEYRGLCSKCLDPTSNPAPRNEVVVDGKVFYMSSKDRWECGHDGKEARTEFEGWCPFDIRLVKPSTLINEMKGICPTCMEKWHKLEPTDGDDVAELSVPSCVPGGNCSTLPKYDGALGSEGQIGENDVAEDYLPTQLGLLDLDDGPTKGKGVAHAATTDKSLQTDFAATGLTPAAQKFQMEAMNTENEVNAWETHADADADADADGGENRRYLDNRSYEDDGHEKDDADKEGYYGRGGRYCRYNSDGESFGAAPKVEIEIDPNADMTVEVEINSHG